MGKLRSCGFIIFRTEPELSFLLMQHPNRWDLPKGHVDKGETDMECALRELHEETGIENAQIEIDEDFQYVQHYNVSLAKYNHKPRQKTLIIYLAKLKDAEQKIILTEHKGYQWMTWEPPHDIQAKTINPLLQSVEKYWDKKITLV